MRVDAMSISSTLGAGEYAVVVGRNGAGKSRILRALAEHYLERGAPVTVVCNTIYDRFDGLRGIERLGLKRGRNTASDNLKRAFSFAVDAGLPHLRRIGRVLHYCGYKAGIGLRIRGFDPHRMDTVERVDGINGISAKERDELRRLAALALFRRDLSKPYWFEFDRLLVREFIDADVAGVVKWERELRKAGIIDSMDLLLTRKDGVSLELGEASSGELTLITSLVFLSVRAVSGSVVLIDEPENSLHPEWQREYFGRLADILHYNGATVIVATHAPIVASGAQALDDIAVKVFRAVDGRAEPLALPPKSVEGTLWQVFGTVTPMNHYVSERLVEALDELERGHLTRGDVETLISRMESVSYDAQQKRVFAGARELVAQISGDADGEER